jgi:hypothetical protein
VTGYSEATWGSPIRAFTNPGTGYYDAFVAKLDTNGALQWNTFLGGSSHDYGYGIAVDTSGNSYVTGWSYVTWGSPLLPFAGYYDAFVAKLDTNGALQWNTFLGGSDDDYGYGIAVDTSGNSYVTGYSEATWGSPIRAFTNPGTGYYDAFVAKIGNGVRVDFNRDGQEDILWRYYGEGGYNRAWFLGDSEAAGLPLIIGDSQMAAVGAGSQSFGGGSLGKSDRNLRGMGMTSNRLKQSSSSYARDLMGTMRRGSFASATVDDPRKAGGIIPDPSRMRVADPRLVKLTLTPESSSDRLAVIAWAPMLLGGADVMPVGDLNWQIVGSGDFNNDTHVDILWRNISSGTNVVWFMNGTDWSGSAELIPVGDLSWKVVGTGDFNSDTHVDILWRNISSGTNVVWYMDETEWIGSAVLLGVSDPAWQIVGTGDFNKDGNVDILWRYNGTGGYNVVWHMDDAAWIGSAELIPVGDTTWQIAGTGDYNNDGNIDILWRYNGAGGYNYIWYMDGVTWSGGGDLLPVADLTWKIVSR